MRAGVVDKIGVLGGLALVAVTFYVTCGLSLLLDF